MKNDAHWHFVSLEEVADVQTGLSKSAGRSGETVALPYLRVANVQDGHFDLSEVKKIEVPSKSVDRYRVRSGDVLLTEGGDFDKLGRGAVWRGQIENCVHQNHVFVVRPHGDRLDERFLAYQTQGPRGRAYFQSCSKQSTNLASINSTQLKQFPTALPPLPEQRKIADILTTWHEAIEKLDALIAAKVRRKKALVQQLMSGKKRLGCFKSAWPVVTLGDVARKVADANKGRKGGECLYGVTKAEGVVPMREHVKGADFARCKHVEPDWFAYNPMRINIGSIARWKGSETVMVSGDYVVFRCLEKKLLPAYLDHIRQTDRWQYFMKIAGSGSVRVRIYFRDLAEFTFPCPPNDEQKAIGEVLDTCDAELNLLRRQRDAIDLQKRGLMQRLLTGKIRVKTP